MQQLIADILTAWRRAMRLRDEHPHGTPEHAVLADAVRALREQYAALTHAQAGVAREPSADGPDGQPT